MQNQDSTVQPTSESLPIGNANVVGRLIQEGPHDRYRQTAAFICGYCSIPSERVEGLAEIIRNRANQAKPYELAPLYERMKQDGIPITEHQNKIKFGHLIKKYQIEELNTNKPCECTG